VATHDADAAEWALRPYDASTDEAALYYLLGVAYARSRAGYRAGASEAGRRRDGAEHDEVAARRAFMDSHRPVWTWLLEHADVTLAVDRERPDQIWAWLVTSEPNVVHAVGCKRSLIEAKLAVEVVRDMLGHRLHEHQVCSLELPQLRTRRGDAIGMDRPQLWSLDPTWLLTRMMPRQVAA
jgi:hypothetical protein